MQIYTRYLSSSGNHFFQKRPEHALIGQVFSQQSIVPQIPEITTVWCLFWILQTIFEQLSHLSQLKPGMRRAGARSELNFPPKMLIAAFANKLHIALSLTALTSSHAPSSSSWSRAIADSAL